MRVNRVQSSGGDVGNYLLFKIDPSDSSFFAVNASEIKEVLIKPRLHKIPGYHAVIDGTFDLRGVAVSVADTCQAIGRKAMPDENKRFVIVLDNGRSAFGLLAYQVSSIIKKEWADMLSPPSSLGNQHCASSIFNHSNIEERGSNSSIVIVLDVNEILKKLK